VKFTGQVRVPEVDHPGVPATIVVEEGQTEVFLEGESLGRWSLFDVRAARLVSSAFSLSLDGEEITFIADEPVDFAYKGVDHMAGVWARYKSMTIPRRVVAVGRSRRGTIPSRIPELRDAMLQNLQTAGRGSSRLASMDMTTAPAEASPWTKRIDSYSNVPEPIDADRNEPETLEPDPVLNGAIAPSEREFAGPEMDEPEMDELEIDRPEAADLGDASQPEPALIEIEEVSAFAPEPEPPMAATVIEEAETIEDAGADMLRAPLRPGPGLIPRRVERTPAKEETEPLWDEAWLEPPVEDEPYDDVPPDANLVFPDEDPQVEVADDSDVPVVEAEEALIEEESIIAEEMPQEQEPEPSFPTQDQSADDDAVAPSIEDWILVAAAEEPARPEMVVDLDHLHIDETTSLEPDLELLFAGAPSPEGEKSGLLGAVRSAFARNKTSHEHEFVEAPGGIGIVRQICADCGYISIGVSD
jgi:hypothetical protein